VGRSSGRVATPCQNSFLRRIEQLVGTTIHAPVSNLKQLNRLLNSEHFHLLHHFASLGVPIPKRDAARL
jgi:hypothetical protein